MNVAWAERLPVCVRIGSGAHALQVRENALAGSSTLSRNDHPLGSDKRRPSLRMSARDYRTAAEHGAILLGTTSFYGDSVYDVAGKFLGEIEELVLDINSGRVAYALIAVGGFLGMGRKLFGIPWSMVLVDRAYQRCVINIELERLIDAPGLDGDALSRIADPSWAVEVHAYFGCKPYWE